jgi:Holliday junction resolvase
MKLEVHQRLSDLSAATEKEYGKLVQKLLALALLEAGAEGLTDRSTQGIDLEATIKGKRRAIEVKTTESGAISLGKKDLEGLAAREKDGARAYIAVLGNRFLDEWTFARFHPGELQPSQSYSITQLRPYRDHELERGIARFFDEMVLTHADAAARGGQRALDEVLAAHPQYRRA